LTNLGNSALIATLVVLAGCSAPPKQVLPPPQIIRVPTYIPLPPDCGELQPVVLPPGSTALDVMKTLNAAVKAYNDQVERCFNPAPP
jgi:hypothetical protein